MTCTTTDHRATLKLEAASLHNHRNMGRGKAWDVDENCLLARAWVSASEEPVAGADQKAKVFFDTMYRRFVEKAPCFGNVVEGKYGFRSSESCLKHVAELSADAQKFEVALRKVLACNPTGVNEDDILSMAVAVHMGKARTMDYEIKSYCNNNWLGYKACCVWSLYPKWSICAATECEEESPQAVDAESAPTSQDVTLPTPSSSISNLGGLKPGSAPESSVWRTPTDGTPGRLIGSRNAKLVRQEELRTQALRSMAESAMRNSDALEERNAIALFSRPESESMPETEQFFVAIRQTHLSQALKKARVAREEVRVASSVNAEETPSDAVVTAVAADGGTEASELSEGAPSL